MRIHVEFGDPEHGWIPLSVHTGEQAFSDSMSYTPYDSLTDLVAALHQLADGTDSATVLWSGEPYVYAFRFRKHGDQLALVIAFFPDSTMHKSQETVQLEASGSYAEICRPFWKALRDLQGRLSDHEISQRWHRDFPTGAVENLTERIRSMGQTGR